MLPLPFVRDLARHGDRPALLTDDRVVSYAELASLVNEFASRVRGDGGKRLVLIGGANRPGAIVAYLGALAAGHVVLLVDGDGRTIVDSMVSAWDPDVVVLPTHAGSQHWTIEERRTLSSHDLHPDLALLLSTSGSTGSPKLVRLSYDNLSSNAAAIVDYLGITDSDRAATTLPMHYCYGLSVIHSHLLAGAGLVLTDLSVVDPCFWDLLRARSATSFAGVPYTFELLERVRFSEKQLPTLRYITQAGGRLAPEQVRRWAQLGQSRGWEFFVMYGQTEATARMAYLPPPLAAAQPGLIGVPIPGGSLRVDPVADAPSGTGELVYRGPNVMMGYAEEPADLALGRTINELRTGDLARENADGMYEIVGRRSAFVKIAGLRVELEQVERNLASAGLVAAASGTDEHLVVAVETERCPDDVRHAVLETLSLPGRAVRVVVVEALPRLPSGKIDRAAVLALEQRGAATSAPAPAPRDGVDRVQGLYAEVLEREVGPTDSFVSLGGDSLSYIQASIGLEEIVGRLPEQWPTMSVAELGELSRAGVQSSRGRLRSLLALRSVETGVALRALAIIAIVSTHIGFFSLPAGAHILFAVVGFNFARFQLTSASRVERVASQLRSLARIVVPAVLWIGLLLIVGEWYEWQSLFLLNALVGPETWNNGWQFWFVEMLVYVLIALAVLTSVRWFDRAERLWPYAVAMGVVGVGLLFRFGIIDFGVPNPRPVLWLFALGWAATRATSVWQRLLIVGVAAVALPGWFGDLQRELLILGGIMLLTFVRNVRMPAFVTPVAGVLASASLYIYLVHWEVFPKFAAFEDWVAVAASLAVGVAVWFVAERVPVVVRKACDAALAARARSAERAAAPQMKLRYNDVIATG